MVARSWKEKEEWFSTALRSIGDAIIGTNIKGYIRYMNPVAETLTGWSEEEAIGKPLETVFKIISEETGEPVENPAQTVLKKGITVGLANHTLLINKNGSKIPIDDSAAPIKDNKGKITGVILVFRDVIEKKKTEEKLRKSEAEKAIIFENMVEHVVYHDPNNRVIWVNKAVCQDLGKEMSQIVGKFCYQVWHNSNEPCSGCCTIKAAKTGIPQEKTIFYQGKYRLIKAYPIKDKHGHVEGVVEVGLDVTEEKKALEALKESEERYRNFVQNLPIGVYRSTPEPDGRFIMANRTFINMLGYESEEELENIPAKDIYMTPEQRKEFSDIWVTKDCVSETELYLKKKDGSPLWVSDTFKVILDEKGKVVYFDCTAEDITKRKQTEIKLTYRTKFMEALFYNSPYAIVLIDKNHKIVNINEEFEKLFGYSLAECEGKDLDYIVSKKSMLKESEEITGKLFKNKRVALEVTRYNKKGEAVEVSIKGVLIEINGETAGGYGIYQDITEKKRAEKDLQQSEEKYREILETMEEGYYEVDLLGTITFCNEATGNLLGYSPEYLVGMNFQDFNKEPDLVFQVFHQVLLSGKPDRGFTIEMIRKDGSIVYGEISVSLIKDKNGNAIGFRGAGRDITERKKFEEKLKYLSFHDQMTGIYNRLYFENELNRLDRSREYPIAIICMDIDGLKLINDSMGHRKGDEILKACAQVIKKPLRSSDILARIGGDEFAAILPHTSEVDAEGIIRRIRNEIENHNRANPEQVLSISLGIAVASKNGDSLDEVFKKADNLMYRDKLYRSASARSQIVNALMATLAERDHILEGHSDRMQDLCQKLGKRIKLGSKQMADLSLLAHVHDLGKVGIPDNILFKNGRLTNEEWKIMRQHSEKGFRIASSSPDLAKVADLILRHHERWDGFGYPLGLKGEEIPVECRILAIVDAYDAMTNNRPYRKAMIREDALAEIQQCSGSQFDPELVREFLEIVVQGQA